MRHRIDRNGTAGTRDAAEAPDPRYLFAVDGEHTTSLFPLVGDLLAATGGSIVLAGPVAVPEQTPLDTPGLADEAERLVAKYGLRASEEWPDHPVEQVVKVGHNRAAIIESLIDQYDPSVLITEDQPRSGIRSRLGFDDVDSATTCDTIVATTVQPTDGIERVLIPIARGPHSGMAIDTGVAIASRHDAAVELLHVSDRDDESQRLGKELLGLGMDRVGDYPHVEHTLSTGVPVVDGIKDASRGVDLTVLGAPREGRLRQYLLGTIPDEVADESQSTTLVTHRGGVSDSWLQRWI